MLQSTQREVFFEDRPVVRALFFAPRKPVDEAAARFVPPALFLAAVLVAALLLVERVLVLVLLFDALPARVLVLPAEPADFVARLERAAAPFDAVAVPRFVLEAFFVEAGLRAVAPPRVELVFADPADVRRAVLFVEVAFLALLAVPAVEVFPALFVAPLSPDDDAAARRFVPVAEEAFELVLFVLRPFAPEALAVARLELPLDASELRPEVLRAELALRAPDDARRVDEVLADAAFLDLRLLEAVSAATNLKNRLVSPPSRLS